jgi:hypothetical protein
MNCLLARRFVFECGRAGREARGRIRRLLLCFGILVLSFPSARAQAVEEAETASGSPWMAVPIVSVDPKLGTSLGALVGYVHYFDEESPASLFGLTGQYTSTGSLVLGAAGKVSFGQDRHRILALLASGEIKNDYEDYLGTGVSLKSDDDLSAVALRYLYRVSGDWFIGAQGLSTNYLVVGETAWDQQYLDILGITGFTSGGIGMLAYHDSRDDENGPRGGWLLNANNIAYREWLGGSQHFDVYRMDVRAFWSHGKGHVFGLRQNNQWTEDAPAAALAPVKLRGYKVGQYLGKYMSSIELEERARLAERWTSTLFAGVACLYGEHGNCSSDENVYPNWGAGIQYVLRPQERMVVNLEYAAGKEGNYGLYIKFGYGF